jgi:hypothetical protein
MDLVQEHVRMILRAVDKPLPKKSRKALTATFDPNEAD